MDEQGVRPSVAIGVGVFLAALAAVVVVLESARRPAPPTARAIEADEAKPTVDPPAAAGADRRRRTDSNDRASATPEALATGLHGLGLDEDVLRAARERMPANLYWELGGTTQDETALAARNEEQRRVLTGEATEAEIHAWYEYRRRLADDFLELAGFLRQHLRGRMTKEVSGALDLAVSFHSDSLSRIPSELEHSLQMARDRAQPGEERQQDRTPPGDAVVDPGRP